MSGDRFNVVFEPIDFYTQRSVSTAIFSSLLKEAEESRQFSERIESFTCRLDDAGAVSNRGRSLISGPGPALNDFHHGLGLSLATAFAASEGEVLPTRASYLYYTPGDYTFFHHDANFCHITIIIALTSGLPHLIAYPYFGAVDAHDVGLLNSIPPSQEGELAIHMNRSFQDRASATPIPLDWEYATIIKGRRVPHARPVQDKIGTVCTACYAFINPPVDWRTPLK